MKWIGGLVLMVLACSGQERSGNSVETENAVALQVTWPDGKPAARVMTRIRPLWYMADTNSQMAVDVRARDLRSDERGWVFLDSLPEGVYVAHAAADSLGAFCEFSVGQNVARLYAPLVLSATGSLSGQVVLPPGSSYAWIYVLGLDKVARSDSTGYFSLSGLPEGSLRVQALIPGREESAGEAFVQVRSGKNADVGQLALPERGQEDMALWPHSRIIPLESLISDWMQPAEFPRVMVLRLHAGNFDFEQAMSRGQDLRVTDLNGKALPQQIAFWDASRRRALVRFRVERFEDIRLFWGRPVAGAVRDSGLWAGIRDSLKEALYTVPVDDFEDSLDRSLVPLSLDRASWYFLASDTMTRYFPTMDDGLMAGIAPAGAGRTGKALHFRYTVQNEGSYVLLGIPIGGAAGRDFSALDSVEFWVRGSGNYLFALDKLVGNSGKALFTDTLSADWVRQVVRPKDFAPADRIGGNIGWELIRDSVTNLTWMIKGGGEFWIDDIKIYGLNRDDLR